MPSRVMWRRTGGSRQLGAVGRPTGNITLTAIAANAAGLCRCAILVSADSLFSDFRHAALFEGGLLHSEGDLGVAVRGLQTRVPQPCADYVYLHAGFEEVHGGRVSTISSTT